MKNFKIVMILVAAVAMFCSCGNPGAPTVALTDANSLTETTFDLANPSLPVILGFATSDEKGLKDIKITRTTFDADGKVLGEPVPFPVAAADYEGMTDFNREVVDTLLKAEVENAAKVVYEAVVTNKKDGQASATYTVNVVAPSFTEGNLRWYRLGNTKEGLAEVGLNWENQNKDILANIKPVAGAKLYILEAADYNVTSIDALNAKLTTEATVYRAISATQNGTYDDVIATVYNGKTYLMHITKSTATSETAGTAITVTGTMKTFTNVEPVAAK